MLTQSASDSTAHAQSASYSTAHEQLVSPGVKRFPFTRLLAIKNIGEKSRLYRKKVTFQPPFRQCSRNRHRDWEARVRVRDFMDQTTGKIQKQACDGGL
jgi:hypothetical protein